VVFIGNQQQWEYDGYRTGWWFSNILGINQPEWECNMDRMGYIYIYYLVGGLEHEFYFPQELG
jgi:hypothetical protein